MTKTYKLLILGSGAVGKTSIATRYTTGGFRESHLMTLGANFMLKDVKINNGQKIRLSIWDTAGQERFRKIVEGYYKGAKGLILVYDITNRDSFNELEYWKTSAFKRVPDLKMVLAGNKHDLSDTSREVDEKEGYSLAEKWNIPFFETSAKVNFNIDEVFNAIVQLLIKEN